MIKKQRSIKHDGQKMTAVDIPNKQASKAKTAFFAVLLVIILVTAIALMISQKAKPKIAISKPITQRQNEVKKAQPMEKTNIIALINRVSDLILVKNGEEPTVATVQDADILRQSNPVFYKDAQNGDRLLVWSDKAVLYSTKMDKLLAIMPIMANQPKFNLSQTTSTVSQAQATSTEDLIQSENATVEIRNGTLTPGMAKSMANLLKIKHIKIGVIGDANSKDFDKTAIIKLTDKAFPATLAAIQEVTKGQISELSTTKLRGYRGDFVVIVGRDFVK